MHFKKIYLHGFKSFAEPITVEFHPGVTCIVGPNGSGKSNISDAIRWVLGEQSPKTLRGGKMEEVIFAGTASRKSRGMAEVTLVIDNTDGELPIEYNEVAITRRMYRSGESEYSINNNQCRLRDIRNLIMDTGIGVDGYSIIGQGKIADIVNGKAESKREIFEEAAGVVAYRTKRAEAERKLAATQNNMERICDIVAEIESRIDGLREDSEKASEYLKLKDESRGLEINITLKNIEAAELKLETFKDEIMEIAADIQDVKERKKEIEASCNEAKEKRRTLETEAEEVRSSLLEEIEEINRLAGEEQLHTEKLSHIEQSCLRIEHETEDTQQKKESLETQLKDMHDSSRQLRMELTRWEETLQQNIEAYADFSGEREKQLLEIDTLREKKNRADNLISANTGQIKSLSELRLNREEYILWLEKEAGGNAGKLEELKRNRDALKSQEEMLEQKVSDAKQRLENLKQKKEDGQHAGTQIAGRLEKLRIAINSAETRKSTIEEMENNYEGYNYAVKHIMKAGISGIEGVVADMIDVPEGYEVAIETALGAGMQNIICRDDSSARVAIGELKKSRAGRLTFLPVSSIRGRYEKGGKFTSEPGFLGIGCECINYDSKYANVMQYLLGRVILADNMDNALRLSKISGGYRIVTLEGEVINASGAMTGGKYKNKTANLLERKSEVARLEKDLEERNSEKRRLEDELEELRNDLSGLDSAIASGERQFAEAGSELDDIQSRLMEQNHIIAGQEEKDARRNQEISNSREELESTDDKIEALKTEISNAQKDLESMGTELEKQEALYKNDMHRADELNEAITAARVKTTSIESEMEANDTLISEREKTVAELEEALRHSGEELTSLKAEKEQLEDGSQTISEELADKKARKEHTEEYIKEIDEERNKAKAVIEKTEAETENLNQQLESLNNNSYETEIRKTKVETQLDTYKNKLWEDFEISYLQALSYKDEDFVLSTAVKQSRTIRNRIRELGDVNVGAIEEYKTVKERYDFMIEQRDDIQQARDSLDEIIKDMDKSIKIRFKENFEKVLANFEDIFRELFGGGHAQLVMDNEDNPLESNIEIVAQPPGKKLQNINLLSGGEKTMTAIALMFAVLKAKPTPFCILDEVEAALDDRNIERFSKYLKNFNNIQFALITHQKATMEHADVLYGVTMPEQGISRILSLKLGDKFDLE